MSAKYYLTCHSDHTHKVKSFVEELVIEDDPEYKWIDKIRTTRASNEARQLLFLRLASSLQRKVRGKWGIGYYDVALKHTFNRTYFPCALTCRR